MKETWVKPVAEKVEFDYKDQVVASGVCTRYYDANNSSCPPVFA